MRGVARGSPSFDKESADQSRLPDGGVKEVVDILCQLSRKYALDWQISSDFGELGFIRGGTADPMVSGLEYLGDALGELDGEEFV